MNIYYFNINYQCNNNCIFCFSHFKSDPSRTMDCDTIIEALRKKGVTGEDIIVINGGEPSVHPHFYELLKMLKDFEARKVIYSNGVQIDVSRINDRSIEFMIPVHGEENTHDAITMVSGSHDKTINTLKELQKAGVKYNIKYIISQEMIHQGFSIWKQLQEDELHPNRIYLARLNETPKSKKKGYLPPVQDIFLEYLSGQIQHIKDEYDVCFLDIPPCYIKKIGVDINPIDSFDCNRIPVPSFFYNDKEHIMLKENYRKERLHLMSCNTCRYHGLCDLMNEF